MRATARRLDVLAALAVLAAGDAGAGTDPVEMEVITPRHEGYVIGDRITQTVRLALGDGYRLDEHSLPRAGRVDLWLELRPAQVHRHGGDVDVDLTYQLINAPDLTRELAVPQQTLRVTGAERSLPVFVPEWRFTATPIVPAGQRGAAARFNLRPERLPPPLDPRLHAWLLGAALAAWIAVLALLAWLYFGLPWRAARTRPFAQALRELRRLRGGNWDQIRQREAFRIVHRALDRTAGCTLLPTNLDELFRAHPALIALRARIESLLFDSRRLFFAPDAVSPATSLDALTELCRDCRELERAMP